MSTTTRLIPRLAPPEEFDRFVAALHKHGMGLILDIVPNHMGIMGSDNAWWLDVLENGEASAYASYFDIDWEPVKDELDHKVLVPVLGRHLWSRTRTRRTEADFRPARRASSASCTSPIASPSIRKEYPRILQRCADRFSPRATATEPELIEFQSLVAVFGHLAGTDRS